MKLTFINSQREERLLAICESIKEAEEKIQEFLKEHNYTSYYNKVTMFETKWVYDVGSWTEFFVIYKNDDVELNKYNLWQEAK